MNRHQRTLYDLLHQNGFCETRSRRHRKFRHNGGLTFVVSKTPSAQGAYQQQLAVLKRLLRKNEVEPNLSIVPPWAPETESQQLAKPLFPVNNPPRSRAEVRIPKLDPAQDATNLNKNKEPVRIYDIVQVLMAADESEEFWKLDACGRIRALITVMRQSPNPKIEIEILPAQFIRASVDEVSWHFGFGESQRERLGDPKVMLRREAPLGFRTMAEWGFTGVPSLLVHDPLIGPSLVEASAWSTLENTDYLFLRYGEGLNGTSYGIGSCVWDAEDPTRRPVDAELPDHFIYSTFITRGMVKRKKFTLQTCAAWVDPKLTRNAVRQILEIMRDGHNGDADLML